MPYELFCVLVHISELFRILKYVGQVRCRTEIQLQRLIIESVFVCVLSWADKVPCSADINPS